MTDPLTIACPHCKAAPGPHCVAPDGRRAKTHRARLEAAGAEVPPRGRPRKHVCPACGGTGRAS